MNKNIKQIIVVLLTIVVAYIAYKLIMGLFWALIVGVSVYIGYKIVTKTIGGNTKGNIEQ